MGKCSSKEGKKVLMLGLDGAGKTALLYQVRVGELVTTIPTIGFNVETVMVAVSKKLPLTVWDIGGQDKIRPLWRHYFSGTSGLMFVVDSTDEERMSQAREELLVILDNNDMKHVPLVIIANKQDLSNALTPEKVAELLNIDEISEKRQCRVVGVSAATSKGVSKAFHKMGKLVKKSKK